MKTLFLENQISKLDFKTPFPEIQISNLDNQKAPCSL